MMRKTTIKFLEFVLKARNSHPGRGEERFSYIKLDGDYVYATDGHRMHFFKRHYIPFLPGEDGVYDAIKKKSEFIFVKKENLSIPYPDVAGLLRSAIDPMPETFTLQRYNSHNQAVGILIGKHYNFTKGKFTLNCKLLMDVFGSLEDLMEIDEYKIAFREQSDFIVILTQVNNDVLAGGSIIALVRLND